MSAAELAEWDRRFEESVKTLRAAQRIQRARESLQLTLNRVECYSMPMDEKKDV